MVLVGVDVGLSDSATSPTSKHVPNTTNSKTAPNQDRKQPQQQHEQDGKRLNSRVDNDYSASISSNGPYYSANVKVNNMDHQLTASKQKQATNGQLDLVTIEPSKKRYFILFMFVCLHMIKSFQWICLASVTNVVAHFYRVDNLAINWTTILFMVTFLLLAMPISWLMEWIGLRRSVLIGTLGVTCGVTIKCFSCHHNGFMYCMLGHLIVGLAEPFFFSSYSQVASVWFPDNQVAMATAWSVVGEQLGLALGFIIPPIMVGSDPNDDATIQLGLFRLFLAVAIISSINTLSIVLFFDEKPKFAPGVARYKQIIHEEQRRRSSQAMAAEQFHRKLVAAAALPQTNQATQANTVVAVPDICGRLEAKGTKFSLIWELKESFSQQAALSRNMLLNKHFILLLIGFGILEGTVYSVHTLLNQMITRATPIADLLDVEHLHGGTQNSGANYSDSPTILVAGDTEMTIDIQQVTNNAQKWNKNYDEDATLIVGNTGLISILAGLIGSALCGHLLDKYHRYKLTAASIYILTLVSMVVFTICLQIANPIALYLAAIPLGFAFTGYASCGFDYAVEITYPNPELLSSTLLNISAQICGIPISLIGSVIVDNHGSEALGLFFSALLVAGFLVACAQGGQLKRQNAVKENEQSQQPLKMIETTSN